MSCTATICVDVDCTSGTPSPSPGGTSDCAVPFFTVTCPSTTSGTVDDAFSSSVTATGGSSPYSYGINGGSLPPGLSLNSGTGAVTGTPTTVGTFAFTVQVTDNDGTVVLTDCAIDIDPAPAAPPDIGGLT